MTRDIVAELTAERQALNEKMARLRTFGTSKSSLALSEEARKLLREQYTYMLGYSRVLFERIELFMKEHDR